MLTLLNLSVGNVGHLELGYLKLEGNACRKSTASSTPDNAEPPVAECEQAEALGLQHHVPLNGCSTVYEVP